jgi:outer membrane protein assembly factor BamB
MFRQVWALFPISHSERLISIPLLVATNVQIASLPPPFIHRKEDNGMKSKNKHNVRNYLPNRATFAVALALALLLAACDSPVTAVEVVSARIVSTPTSLESTPTNRVLMPTGSGDWSTYLSDNAHSGFNQAETRINVLTTPMLKQHWMYHARGVISTQPVEANGMIYWGSWDGLEHAMDLNGHEVWAANLGGKQGCIRTVGVASTATVASVTIGGRKTPVVFVGGGDSYFYALNASNGKVIWQTLLGFAPADFIWSSPIVYKGDVYIGVSSFADCPTVQGKLVQMNAKTGSIQHIFNTVPAGCQGGAVWDTPAIDESTGELYLATGNPDICSTAEPYADAVIELHTSNLAFVGSWQVPPSQTVDDSDFGSAPTLFTATIGGVSRALVGIAHKNGRYYAFARGAISRGPVWTRKIARGGGCPECGKGSISPSAWDGTRLYVAGGRTAINGVNCRGSVRALDPATGAYLWEHCLTDGTVLAAVTVVPGVVVVEDGSAMVVLAAASGQTLFSYKDHTQSSVFYGAASISNGMLYVGNFDGNFYAFGL